MTTRNPLDLPVPTTPQQPMGLGRAAVTVGWFFGLVAGPIWIGLHYGWKAGSAIGAWMLFTAVFFWGQCLWDLKTDGYILDKVPAPNGRRRWRVRLAEDPQARTESPVGKRNPNKQ